MNLLNWLKGKKTYILVALGVVYAVSGYYTGNLDGQAALEIIWVALMGGTVRAGIAKGK